MDTGPIVAILSDSDHHHDTCLERFRTLPSPLLTCWPVLVEAAWMLRLNMSWMDELLASFQSGVVKLIPLDEADLPGIAAILAKYRDQKIQLADASLLYVADREGIHSIFTLDRRDFQVLRLKNGRPLHLIS